MNKQHLTISVSRVAEDYNRLFKNKNRVSLFKNK